MNNQNILFVGLGKLGLSLAAILSKKHNVLGYDIDTKLIDSLRNKNFFDLEKDVKEFLSNNTLKIHFTNTLDFKKLNKLKSIFILIPTNSSPEGEYSYKNLLKLINEILNKLNLNKKLVKKKIIINICSTLQPGTYTRFLKPLEKKYKYISFTYVPEFVACGTTIKDFLYPDQLVVGSNDTYAGNFILKQYLKVINAHTVNRLSVEGCEMVKLCTNSFVCNKISFANLISEICYNYNIKDSAEVLRSIGIDSRIGNKFFKSGPPFGGLCFPKDVKAFKKLCQKSNVNSRLASSIEEINENKYIFLIKRINAILKKNNLKNIGFIGYTFKEDTKVSDGSQYEKIMLGLKIPKIYIYDENINFLSIQNKLVPEKSLANLLKNSKHIFIFHNKKTYYDLAKKHKKNIFYSVWSSSKEGIFDLNKNFI